MGTNQHKPGAEKAPPAPHTHENAKAEGPGVRPGTRSRLLEARERAKARDGA